MTCPSTDHVISQTTFFDSLTPFCADESLNDGNEGAMLARSTEDSSRGGAHDQQHKHPVQDAEASEYQQDGLPGEY